MRRSALALPTVLLATCLASACGTDAPRTGVELAAGTARPDSVSTAGRDEPVSASLDPCALLTDAEVSEALGTAVTSTSTTFGEPLGGQQCLWASTGSSIRSYALTVHRAGEIAAQLVAAGESPTTLYERERDLHTSREALPDLGDDAWYADSAAGARKGDLSVSALVLLGTSPNAKAALIRLTRTATSRL